MSEVENTQVESTEQVEQVETPVETAVEPAPAPQEFVYEYQPVDDLGRPLGAKQVFKGVSAQEVLDKVAKAHQESIKLNRELNKNLRLGILPQEQEEIPDSVARFDESEMEFKPRQLTDEERIQISRDLLDPEKFDEASERLFEAKLGAKPERITSSLTKTNEALAALQAKEEARLFVQSNPDYYVCPDNFRTLTTWMIKNRLSPTATNFEFAFNKLKAVGLLLEAPIVREETPRITEPVITDTPSVDTPTNSQPGPETASRITSQEPSQEKRPVRVATGLNRNNTSDVGTTVKSTKLTRADIDKMSSDEYKRRLLREPGFKEAVEEALLTPHR